MIIETKRINEAERLARLMDVMTMHDPEFQKYISLEAQLEELQPRLERLSQFPNSERCFGEAFNQTLSILDEHGITKKGILIVKKRLIYPDLIKRAHPWDIVYLKKNFLLHECEALDITHFFKGVRTHLTLTKADGKPYSFADAGNKIDVTYK